jgi:excisionase family DNA binding protein
MSTHASFRVEPSDFMTVPQAARLLAVHPSTIRRWISLGRLSAYRVGDKGVRIAVADVLDLVTPLRPDSEAGEALGIAQRLGIHRLTGDERDEALAASAAARWFREKLRKKYGTNVPTSAELLNAARNECAESFPSAQR